jgi:hypothetical protein
MYVNNKWVAWLQDATYIFKPKIPIWVNFLRVLQWEMLISFMAIWYIVLPIHIFYDHLVYFLLIWNIFPHFGMLKQDKSGNPDSAADAYCA